MNAKEATDLSVLVYSDLLGADDVARMLAKDADQGQKLRSRASAYDQLSRAYYKRLCTGE